VTAAPGQVAAINSAEFPVVPAQTFTLTFDARVAPTSADSGYFDIVFLAGTEISRTTLNIAAAPVRLGTAETDRRGVVEAPISSLADGTFLVEASFKGDDRWFPAYGSATIARPRG
jgi:hypothetical protein